MAFEMRSLQTSDIFKVSKILKKMNLKGEIKSIINKSDSPKNEQQKEEISMSIGAEISILALENMHMAEKECNEFLGSLVGLTAEEFSKLEIDKTAEVIELLTQNPSIPAFLGAVGRLMK